MPCRSATAFNRLAASILAMLLSPLLPVAATEAPARPGSQAEDDSPVALGRISVGRTGLVVLVGNCEQFPPEKVAPATGGVVQQLLPSAEVDAGRDRLASAGLAGKVTVAALDPDGNLPYVDTSVNLLIIAPDVAVRESEPARVLAPGGKLVRMRTGSEGQVTLAPDCPERDGWTHYLHDATGNAVAADSVVAPPQGVQWIAGPRWSRSHETNSSIGAVVSDGRRIYLAVDEGITGIAEDTMPSRWSLVARDAYNGTIAWKRPLGWGWERWGPGNLWKLPQALPRTLVAGDEQLFVATEFLGPVRELDTETGRTRRTYEGTEGTAEILHLDGLLVVHGVIVDESVGPRGHHWVAVLDASSGNALWRKRTERVVDLSLAAGRDVVVYHDGSSVVCRDLRTGRRRWTQPMELFGRFPPIGTFVIHDRWVYCVGQKGFRALSLTDGSIAWRVDEKQRSPFRHPPEIFIAQGLVWAGQLGGRQAGRDPATGEIRREIDVPELISPGHHYRCYRTKATERFLIFGKRGAEFLDLVGDDHMRHDWFRGACMYGILPANGLVYAPPHPCFCYPGVKLAGLHAFHPRSAQPAEPMDRARAAGRRTRGPAWGQTDLPGAPRPDADDWPMYRRDATRSAFSPAPGPGGLATRWSVKLSAPATAPVVAAGRVLVAETNAHRLRCFAAEDGREIWSRTLDGRIDSPPTVDGPRVLVGTARGRVHCLRLSDGATAWSFRAAPVDRQIVCRGQLESVWPAHGGVLVQNGKAYVAAGRSTHVDGGIFLWALDPLDGEVCHHAVARTPRPDVHRDRGRAFDMDGAANHLLVGDGNDVYLSQLRYAADLSSKPTPRRSHMGDMDTSLHLMATGGFLEDMMFNRTFWAYWRRWPGFYFANQAPKSGQLLTFDNARTYAAKIFRVRRGLSPDALPGQTGTLLCADDNDNEPILKGEKPGLTPMQWIEPALGKRGHFDNKAVNVNKGTGYTRQTPPVWTRKLPIVVRAMVRAGDRLIVAGPHDRVADDKTPEAFWRGQRGGMIYLLAADSGEVLAEREVDFVPAFDALVAAGDAAWMTTQSGRLIRLGATE